MSFIQLDRVRVGKLGFSLFLTELALSELQTWSYTFCNIFNISMQFLCSNPEYQEATLQKMSQRAPKLHFEFWANLRDGRKL